MTDTTKPLTGTCRCGATRMALATAPVITAACHRRGCQQMTADAFSLSALVPKDVFEVTRGSPVIGGLHGPEQRHHFCPECMSWMFTRIEDLPFVNVRSSLLDDLALACPFVETMTAEKLDWATTPAVHSFEGFPPPEVYGELMAAFARR